jgi:hypothetical protein
LAASLHSNPTCYKPLLSCISRRDQLPFAASVAHSVAQIQEHHAASPVCWLAFLPSSFDTYMLRDSLLHFEQLSNLIFPLLALWRGIHLPSLTATPHCHMSFTIFSSPKMCPSVNCCQQSCRNKSTASFQPGFAACKSSRLGTSPPLVHELTRCTCLTYKHAGLLQGQRSQQVCPLLLPPAS